MLWYLQQAQRSSAVAFAYFKYELRFYGSTSSVDSNLVGISAKGKRRHTDGQVWGSPFIPKRAAFDVGKEDPNAVSLQVQVHIAIHFSTRMQGPDLQRSRKLTSTKSYASSLVLTSYRSFITASGGMGEQFQRQYWNSHWSRVDEEDEQMRIGPWVCDRSPGQIRSRGCKLQCSPD